jgi:chromosome segregation ATPase
MDNRDNFSNEQSTYNNDNYIGQLQCKIRSLENQSEIYKKEISILEEKIKVFEEDTSKKAAKINEQLNQITALEKENSFLKQSLSELKTQINTDKNILLSTAVTQKDEHNNELINLQTIIDDLQRENEKIKNENDLYNQDNTILLTKVKEYEEHNANINNPTHWEKTFDNQINEYTRVILSEIKIISQFIDTYIAVNYNTKDLNQIPNIFAVSNFPEDSFINFDSLKQSVENARKRFLNEQASTEKYISELKGQLVHYSKLLEIKLKEMGEMKLNLSELKEMNCKLHIENDKLNKEIRECKMFNRKIQSSYNEFDESNVRYFENIYNIIKKELEKILHDGALESYAVLFLDNSERFTAGNIKFKFEDVLDKLITVNNALVDDVKKLQIFKDNVVNQIGTNSEYENNIRELHEKIGILKNEVAVYQDELNTAKNEKNLLLNQIELLEGSNKIKGIYKKNNSNSNNNYSNDYMDYYSNIPQMEINND